MLTATHHHALTAVEVRAAGRATGALGEDLAVDHLTDVDGLQVLVRNWRVATGELRGELDVVAEDPATGVLVVVEVKTRRDAARFGGALAALHPRQAARIRALTATFLRREAGLGHRRVRLDVVAIDLGAGARLTHVEAAL